MIDNKLELMRAQEKFSQYDYSKLSSLTINNCKKLSLVTSCKDRTPYLYIALQTWEKFPFDEIIIVDWSSKFPINPTGMPDNVKVIRVDNQDYYEHSKARNFKVSLAKNKMVLSIDCDIMLTPKFASNFFVREGSLIMVDDKLSSAIGSSIFDKRIYEELGGFNEKLDAGWGFEDMDFYNKVDASDYNYLTFPASTMQHINHDDNLRTVNTKEQNKWQSNSLNMKRAMDYYGYKNPIFKEGYTIKYPDGKEEEVNV